METSRAEPDRVDLHELAKGWKAAIARASDPATRCVLSAGRPVGRSDVV